MDPSHTVAPPVLRTYRNDPGRFFGDGVIFKAKLIGILEVGEARGDRMCQEALQDLKMAIRAAGEHKQRITIHVTIDGLRLRDEKTGDSLFHHPVHKISFIAQDMTDSRAFGYIFGSPDSGHRFFGIKTDKAASQVVLAMRDLFQVVFELKKKEIELARQHQSISLSIKNSLIETTSPSASFAKSNTNNEPTTSKVINKELSPESVADLVDLEQELSSIQRGITQMERITPNDSAPKSVSNEEDPFGDSFTSFPQTYNLLPPPESSRSRHSKPLKPPEDVKITSPAATVAPPPVTSSPTVLMPPIATVEDDWLSVPEVDEPKAADEVKQSIATALEENLTNSLNTSTTAPPQTTTTSTSSSTGYIDAFTDLDPLGTGKSKPYIDKKYFFQDLKNPPKKVLKDLSGHDMVFSANFTAHAHDSQSNGQGELETPPPMGAMDLKMFEGTNDLNVTPKELLSAGAKHQDHLFQTGAFTPNHKTDDPIIGNNKALLVSDNDPFSPRMKKFDPFEDDFVAVSSDPFDFNFANKQKRSTILPDTKITSEEGNTSDRDEYVAMDRSVFNGPLQVSLPPESSSTSYNNAHRKIERQNSDSPTSASSSSIARNRPSVFKQNTVDVISNISSKKMKPHLFSSQKFSKRDNNSINMRRLQESDSLSENETAPEPPPRPDSGTHMEPPPLPPKKQFSDIVIRPRITSPLATSRNDSSTRYDYLSGKTSTRQTHQQQQLGGDNAPPLPLPSRKVGRSDTSFPGPGRPAKKSGLDEDDYLTPITLRSPGGLPILQPPPQTKSRARRQDTLDRSSVDTESDKSDVMRESVESIIPDITLSQLLTLGIDDLATKLKVPISKLNTMTLVELTQYLSDFIEKSKRKPSPIREQKPHEAAIFKVSFDQPNEATFIAKFDDNFVESGNSSTFVANFDDFDIRSDDAKAQAQTITSQSSVDRYAVFREIIEQENRPDDDTQTEDDERDVSPIEIVTPPIAVRIDTKITEAISQAKDRYAALRDIILVEDLFEKPPEHHAPSVPQESSEESPKEDDELDDIKDIEMGSGNKSSPEINISEEADDEPHLGDCMEIERANSTNLGGTKDDLEIDEYMNRAISKMSLDSRDHLSPISKSPYLQNASTSPNRPKDKSPMMLQKIPTPSPNELNQVHFNDMSTSPIPNLQRSPINKSPLLNKSPLSKSPIEGIDLGTGARTPRSPLPPQVVTLVENRNSDSLSDVVCGSSPEVVSDQKTKNDDPLQASNESWAVFDQPIIEQPVIKKEASPIPMMKSPRGDAIPKEVTTGGPVVESPCSSDGKEDWKTDQDCNKRWPRGQTSSSSRDLSPWDDDGPEYRRRAAPLHGPDRHGYYMRHARRMNSYDDDYDYEGDGSRRMREKRIKTGMMSARSKEHFEIEPPGYYHSTSNNHHSWSPQDDEDDRPKSFDRSSYDRSTYGPPYEKREPKSLPPYDKRVDYKSYDKRKYYREYARPDYDFDYYDKPMERKAYYDAYEKSVKGSRKDYADFDAEFARDGGGSRPHKGPKEYFYDRERQSFDRESNESYESAGRRRKSFGSGDVYGSLDSRDGYRDKYLSTEKIRSLRKSGGGGRQKIPPDDYDRDSEGEIARRVPGDTRSLQRPSQMSRARKSSGSSPWDGDVNDLTPTSSQKSWKRPSSATESDRRLAESRRGLSHTLSGSDGEKERSRLRKKNRYRGGRDGGETRSNYATMRYPSHGRVDDYDYPEFVDYEETEDFEREKYHRRRPEAVAPTRLMDLEQRKKKEIFDADRSPDIRQKSERSVGYSGGGGPRFDAFEDLKNPKPHKREFEFDDFEEAPPPPRSTATNNNSKFNFNDQEFESDFNGSNTHSTPATTGSAGGKKSFRFSNDFSEKLSSRVPLPPQKSPQSAASSHQSSTAVVSFDAEFPTQQQQQKIRFDDKVTVSKFSELKKSPAPSAAVATPASGNNMFEDDFSKAEFSFENEDKWSEELPKKNNLKHGRRPENIKKSESVNIFAKKVDDPFEDDDFFKSSEGNGKPESGKHEHQFDWGDNNFAKFDDNV